MGKPGVLKQAFQGIGLALLVVSIFFAGGYFFNDGGPVARLDPRETPIDGVTLPNGVILAKPKPVEGSLGKARAIKQKPPGGSEGRKKDHPIVAKEDLLDREIKIPKDVEGKWKAVKLLIKDKGDEEANEFKVVDLGLSFDFGGGLRVTVGPFFPNFVMNELYYTSMNNQLLNPAVRLRIEENGKLIYDGWAFARYPDLYAFEHARYGIQLIDYIPAEAP